MILIWLLIVTFTSGLLAWLVSSWSRFIGRLVCFAGLAVDAALLLSVWINLHSGHTTAADSGWILEYRTAWITPLGVTFHLAMDGISLLFAVLTVFLGISSIAASWKEIDHHAGIFLFAVMSVLTGVLGVFTAVDLFLFYFFWELMLIPMFFLILIWGHKNRIYAAVKFLVFTQAGGLVMLLGIIALYWVHGTQTDNYTFDYPQIVGTSLVGHSAIILGLFIGFAVKIPVVPAHIWQPDAYTEAPTAGSVVLAGLLAKTGSYGIIRFILPLQSGGPNLLTPVALVFAIAGIFYGALMAFGQSDFKRLVAYTSISHLGFVLLGIFSGTQTALQGAIVIMLAHGFSTGALFIIIGALQERIQTRDMTRMGGLWSLLPRMGGMTMFFALASLGLPGLANFIGEFLVLAGTLQVYPWLAGIAAFGFVVSSVYSLIMIYRVFQGPVQQQRKTTDLRFGEMVNLTALMIALIWIGMFPQTVLNTVSTALEKVNIRKPTASYSDPGSVKPCPDARGVKVEGSQLMKGQD